MARELKTLLDKLQQLEGPAARLRDRALKGTLLWCPLKGPQLQAYLSPADILLFGGKAGGGKMLSLDTPLPTPEGWTTMGEVQVGDTLFDERGRPCRVLFLSPIAHSPRSYRVDFSDGSSIVADAEHRWLTMTERERAKAYRRTPEFRKRRRESRPSRATGKCPAAIESNRRRKYQYLDPPVGTVRTTQEILNTLRYKGKRWNHSITMAGALQLPEAALPIHPYVLGLWLGDGNNHGGTYTTADPELVENIRALGYHVVKHRGEGQKYSYGIHGIKGHLRALGILGYKGAKRIPTIYLRASEEQRLWLLQGLMDSDGTCCPCGSSEFYNKNEQLMRGVLELLHSLGIKGTIHGRQIVSMGKGYGTHYRIKFTTSKPVFRLTRKRDRLVKEGRVTQHRLYITGVTPVESRPMRCLAVDSPSHLYLAGESMVPTHNTDLLLGLALNEHRKSIIFRREFSQLHDMVLRSEELLSGTGARYNSLTHTWRDIPGRRRLEFGGVKHENDKEKYKGRTHDLKAFDQIEDFTESQFRFLTGWARTTRKGQRVRIVCTANPPSTDEGRWIIRYWGPWLDKNHPNPAKPGELRWYVVIDGEDREVDGPDPIEHEGEVLHPRSRTFIPASLQDNPYLMATDYETTLQGLPEPLRSQLLHGDFTVAMADSPWQTIPTEWVRAAQDRWTEEPPDGWSLEAIGVDPARGGRDFTAIARRHGPWFGIQKHPGSTTPNGPAVAGLVLNVLQNLRGEYRPGMSQEQKMAADQEARDAVTVNVDVIGVGASVYDTLEANGVAVIGVNFGASTKMQRGRLHFANVRAAAYWALREALDPATGNNLALPPGIEVRLDLTAPQWRPTARGIQIEPKEGIKRRLGRSPDVGDAIVLAHWLSADLPDLGWG